MTRRRKYDDDKPHPSASFTWGHMVTLGLVPVITGAIVLVGQWAVTGDTLKRHDEAFKSLSLKNDEDKKSREEMRDKFMTSQARLIEVLGKLDTRLSVSEKQQEASSRQIEKISDQLQQLNTRPQRTGQ